jgi:hypothetical protein
METRVWLRIVFPPSALLGNESGPPDICPDTSLEIIDPSFRPYPTEKPL